MIRYWQWIVNHNDMTAQLFYLGSILGQGKIMNVPVFYREVNMVFWTLFTNV